MRLTKNKERPNQPLFEVGDEVICRINGERGYIILPFRAAMVAFKEGKPKVIPEDNLCLAVADGVGVSKTFYVKGNKVRVIPTKDEVLIGQVVDSKWFYVVHLYKGGLIKIFLAEILMKSTGKIIPFQPLGMLKINPKNLPRGFG